MGVRCEECCNGDAPKHCQKHDWSHLTKGCPVCSRESEEGMKQITQPVWWIEWKHVNRTQRIDTVPLSDITGLRRKLNHAVAFAEHHKVTVTQYVPAWSQEQKEQE